MQGTQEEIDNAIATLVEEKLIKEIREIYEDITTTGKMKKIQREQCTRKFVELHSKELSFAKDSLGRIVDRVISKTKWIEEIEELDEEFEEER